jgi:hypothetical protein
MKLGNFMRCFEFFELPNPNKQDQAYFGIGNTIRAFSANEASAALPLILY